MKFKFNKKWVVGLLVFILFVAFICYGKSKEKVVTNLDKSSDNGILASEDVAQNKKKDKTKIKKEEKKEDNEKESEEETDDKKDASKEKETVTKKGSSE